VNIIPLSIKYEFPSTRGVADSYPVHLFVDFCATGLASFVDLFFTLLAKRESNNFLWFTMARLQHLKEKKNSIEGTSGTSGALLFSSLRPTMCDYHGAKPELRYRLGQAHDFKDVYSKF
jgi:hypothetical protein